MLRRDRPRVSFLPLVAAVVAGAWFGGAPSTVAASSTANSADGLIFWVGFDAVIDLSDAELDSYAAMGVDAFAVQTRHLKGLGGTDEWTDDPNASLSAAAYAKQRKLVDTKIVARAKDRGIDLYLGYYSVNYYNTKTPFKDWFDDPGWAKVVGKLRDLAGAARMLGFKGLAVDQELYPQKGAQTATWSWNHPGNTHTEAQVRAKVEQRGQEVMRALLGGFPNAEILLHHFLLSDSWAEKVQEEVNDRPPDNYAHLTQIDFWDGMTSVEGYGPLRFLNSVFYKSHHSGSGWDNALKYDVNQLMSTLSREWENWDYAYSRFNWAPMAWINAGPRSSSFDDARPVKYVESQLLAMHKWGMGGWFGNFCYGLRVSEYTPYRSAVQRASTPGTVDAVNPTVQLTARGAKVTGAATDNLGVRAVRWRDNRGGSGVAEMRWVIDSGDWSGVASWHMAWSFPASAVRPGASQVTVTAEDIKGRSSAPLQIAWP